MTVRRALPYFEVFAFRPGDAFGAEGERMYAETIIGAANRWLKVWAAEADDGTRLIITGPYYQHGEEPPFAQQPQARIFEISNRPTHTEVGIWKGEPEPKV